MAERVDKEEHIAGIHVDVDRAFYIVNRGDLPAHAMFALIRMGEMRFVAGRYDHRVAIARSDLRQRHQDVDLPAMEAPVVVTKLRALGAFVAAGMQADRFAGTANVGEALINEERSMIVVKRLRATDKMLDLFDPRRVVD